MAVDTCALAEPLARLPYRIAQGWFEVPNDPVDPETLAALLDGTLTDEERERVLARLAKSEHEYEDLLEAAALAGELNADPSTSTPVPPVALLRDTTPSV